MDDPAYPFPAMATPEDLMWALEQSKIFHMPENPGKLQNRPTDPPYYAPYDPFKAFGDSGPKFTGDPGTIGPEKFASHGLNLVGGPPRSRDVQFSRDITNLDQRPDVRQLLSQPGGFGLISPANASEAPGGRTEQPHLGSGSLGSDTEPVPAELGAKMDNSVDPFAVDPIRQQFDQTPPMPPPRLREKERNFANPAFGDAVAKPDSPIRINIPDWDVPGAINPSNIFRILGGMAEPVNAAGRIMNQGPVHPNDVTEGMAGDALKAVSPLFTTYGQAPANSLGISGAKFLNQSFVQKYISDLARKGMTPAQIKDAVNKSSYGTALDKPLTYSDIKSALNKQYRGGTLYREQKEVPSMRGQRGGQGQSSGFPYQSKARTNPNRNVEGNSPTNPEITTNDVRKMLDDLKKEGLDYRENKAATGSTYFKLYGPNKTDIKYGNTPDIRVPPPNDPHGGIPRPWRIDTNAQGKAYDTKYNVAGEPYQRNMPAIEQQVRHILGMPKQAPAPAAPTNLPADPAQIDWINEILKGGKF